MGERRPSVADWGCGMPVGNTGPVICKTMKMADHIAGTGKCRTKSFFKELHKYYFVQQKSHTMVYPVAITQVPGPSFNFQVSEGK